MGCKDIRIRRSEFVEKTEFLYLYCEYFCMFCANIFACFVGMFLHVLFACFYVGLIFLYFTDSNLCDLYKISWAVISAFLKIEIWNLKKKLFWKEDCLFYGGLHSLSIDSWRSVVFKIYSIVPFSHRLHTNLTNFYINFVHFLKLNEF